MADGDGGKLAGQRAIVTGGASGIGSAAAELLAAQGAEVVIVDKDSAKEGATTAAGGRLIAKQFDLSRSREIPDLVAGIIADHGPIDILVNCAGIVSNMLVLETEEEEWDRVYAVNLKAPFLFIRSVAADMIRAGIQGRIVNVTSSSAHTAERAPASYASSKAALTQLTRTCAAQFGAHGINVNCVAPGFTLTPLLQKAFGEDDLAKLAELVAAGAPFQNLLGRPSMPADVAESILFLTLPASRQITGQTIHTSAGAIL